jgi:hypothetical protein
MCEGNFCLEVGTSCKQVELLTAGVKFVCCGVVNESEWDALVGLSVSGSRCVEGKYYFYLRHSLQTTRILNMFLRNVVNLYPATKKTGILSCTIVLTSKLANNMLRSGE